MPPSEELFPGGAAGEPWSATLDRPELQLEYGGGGAYATADGGGMLEVELDGRRREPIVVDAPALHELAVHDRHEEHRVLLRPSTGVRVWSVSFAAGVP